MNRTIYPNSGGYPLGAILAVGRSIFLVTPAGLERIAQVSADAGARFAARLARALRENPDMLRTLGHGGEPMP